MREMKDSGFNWLRQIPQTWEVFKITRKKCKALQNDPTVLSLARSGVKVRDISTNEGQLAASYYEYNPVAIDDMLLNPMDLQSGANCSISKVEGVISPAYINLRYKKGFNPVFYDYYFKYQYWSYAFFSYGKGVSFDNRWTLNEDTLMNLPLLVPPTDEQKSIAQYLDRECSKIDEVMADIQDQIDTLEEHKKSVIAEAVTKGLNPNAEMKETGIKWIPVAPLHWIYEKAKYCFITRNTKGNSINLELLSPTQKYGVIPQKKYEELTSMVTVKINENTNLMSFKTIHNGDYCISLRSFEGGFEYCEYEGVVSPAYTVFYPTINCSRQYYRYLFKIRPFIFEMNSYSLSLRDGKPISFDNFGNTFIPIPPKKEQDEIAAYLDKKCADIDSIIADKKSELGTLEEYKKSLIYEYVTGKKEVPANE